MVILSISKLNNLQVAGININIPKFVKYLNNKCESAYLDLGDIELNNLKDFKNYFKANELAEKKISLLPEPYNKPDIVVFQSFYNPEFIKISKELKKRNIPYTIVPRCSLTVQAQNKKAIKKHAGNIFGFNKFVKDAKFIHFLTENEYLESRKKFKFNNYVIIGNGTEIPFECYRSKNRDIFKVVYIGRYDIYHKGLDILLECVKKGQSFFRENNIEFDLYGRDSANGLKYINNFVKKEKLNDLVKINDPIFGTEKEKALLDSDVFIHTSRLEGHPTSVIEAISYGIPVVVTPGTNVSEDVKKSDLGFTCELNGESVFKGIQTAFEHKNDFEKITNNEREYAKKHFDWNEIADNIINRYSEALKR